MGRGRGNGKTPEYVVETIKELVAAHKQSGTSRVTGIGLAIINRYYHGIGVPTVETLQKLANYTGKTFTIEIKPER